MLSQEGQRWGLLRLLCSHWPQHLPGVGTAVVHAVAPILVSSAEHTKGDRRRPAAPGAGLRTGRGGRAGVARAYLLSAKVAGQAQLIARRFVLRTVQVGLGTPPSVHTVLPT